MKKLILAIDQGTTATTVLLIDQDLTVVAKESIEILPTFPQAAWVEHDLDQIWDGTLLAIRNLMEKNDIEGGQIAAVGITNQRETVGAWSRKTMIPYGKAIVWQCRRTTERCQELKAKGLEEKFKQKTGLVLDPYFSATKIEWFLKNISGLREKAAAGEAIFGTIDSFLLYRLTFGQVHATDVSNASRTLLMDLKSCAWDKELLDVFGIPEGSLPKIMSSSEVYGRTKNLQVIPDGIPICGILGDQQAALFGQLCIEPGETKITYGTGCFLMTNTGQTPVYSKHGMLTTLGWKIGGKITYALEGSAFVGGSAVQWLRDGLGIIKSSSEVEALARTAEDKDMGDLVFIPALTGLGAPHWNAEARGMIHGLTRGSTKAHIARATLEGIVHQNDDILDAIAQDLGAPLKSLKVDGGASANNFMMQLQSDLAAVKIDRPQVLETTALGAAMAAGLAAGFWPNTEALKKSWKLDKNFAPSMAGQEREKRKKRWGAALKKLQA